jgi:hypothetical protein
MRTQSWDSPLKAAARDEAVATPAEPRKPNRSFWSRASTKAVMKLLDVFASCQWHRYTGCDGSPSMEWLNGKSGREIRLIEHKRTSDERKEDKKAHVARRGPQWKFFDGEQEDWLNALAEDAKAQGALDRAVLKLRKAYEAHNAGQTAATKARVKQCQRDKEAAEQKRRLVPRTLRSETSNRSSTTAALPPAKLSELIVAEVLGEMDSPVLHGLLLHRYPRLKSSEATDEAGEAENPYARPERSERASCRERV